MRAIFRTALRAFAVAALFGTGIASAEDELPTLTIGYLAARIPAPHWVSKNSKA